MEWLSPQQTDGAQHASEHVDFGMIRAIFAARQAASATARAAMEHALAGNSAPSDIAAVVHLLAGGAHRDSLDTGGTAAAAFLPDTHFANDVLVAWHGETHA